MAVLHKSWEGYSFVGAPGRPASRAGGQVIELVVKANASDLWCEWVPCSLILTRLRCKFKAYDNGVYRR